MEMAALMSNSSPIGGRASCYNAAGNEGRLRLLGRDCEAQIPAGIVSSRNHEAMNASVGLRIGKRGCGRIIGCRNFSFLEYGAASRSGSLSRRFKQAASAATIVCRSVPAQVSVPDGMCVFFFSCPFCCFLHGACPSITKLSEQCFDKNSPFLMGFFLFF